MSNNNQESSNRPQHSTLTYILFSPLILAGFILSLPVTIPLWFMNYLTTGELEITNTMNQVEDNKIEQDEAAYSKQNPYVAPYIFKNKPVRTPRTKSLGVISEEEII